MRESPRTLFREFMNKIPFFNLWRVGTSLCVGRLSIVHQSRVVTSWKYALRLWVTRWTPVLGPFQFCSNYDQMSRIIVRLLTHPYLNDGDSDSKQKSTSIQHPGPQIYSGMFYWFPMYLATMPSPFWWAVIPFLLPLAMTASRT